jgi:hypothetical protein
MESPDLTAKKLPARGAKAATQGTPRIKMDGIALLAAAKPRTAIDLTLEGHPGLSNDAQTAAPV